MSGVGRANDRRPAGGPDPIERRAAMHAALGEPARLQLVDQLVLGDASPGELGRALGLATNLLAFHLKVLDEAGLVRRVRSEGDGRRSYVQLRWDDADVAALLAPAADATVLSVRRVVFVCTANSARSQLAAAAWGRAGAVPATSAGTHPAAVAHPRAVAVARRHGLDLAGTTSHVRTAVRPGDLVVAVCDSAHEELVAAGAGTILPVAPASLADRDWLHWAVPDPVRIGTAAAFEAAHAELSRRVDRLARVVRPMPPPRGRPPRS